MNNLIIKKAVNNDLNNVKALMKELILYEQKFDIIVKPDDVNDQEIFNKLNKLIKSNDSIILIVILNNRTIGFLSGFLLSDENIITKKAYMEHLFIRKQYRGKGIGKQLLKKFTKWCLCMKAIIIETNVYADNIIANKFYTKMGFVDVLHWFSNTGEKIIQKQLILINKRYIDYL